MHSIGKLITNLRKERGLSQSQLAQKLLISEKTISKWETDGGIPDIENLKNLAVFFDVSIDYILTGNTKYNEQQLDSYKEKVYVVKNPNLQYKFNDLNVDDYYLLNEIEVMNILDYKREKLCKNSVITNLNYPKAIYDILIPQEYLEDDFNIVLIDWIYEIMYLFYIPKNSLSDKSLKKQTNEYFTLELFYLDEQFVDCYSNVSLMPYFVKDIPYVLLDMEGATFN